MEISSPALTPEGKMPAVYTCKGKNVNPPLVFSKVPENTQSLALTLDDIDAPVGIFNHWLIWNIDPKTLVIIEDSTPSGARVGTNSFGSQNYGGPCPPAGVHRYIFTLYALDTTLTIPSEARKSDFDDVVRGHILGQTSLRVTFP